METALATTTAQPLTALAGALGFDTAILAGSVAPSTQRMYLRDFSAYLAWAGSAQAAMQASTLAQWRAHLAGETTLSPNTINRMISAVKRLMGEAAAQGYASHETASAFDQVAGVRVAALKDRQKADARTAISPEQMRAICTAPDPNSLAGKMHLALLATLAGSGLRISEAATLTPGQIGYAVDDQGAGFFVSVMGKNETQASRRALSTEAHALIQQWLQARAAAGVQSPYIFTGFGGRGSRDPRSTPITPQAAWELVKRYAKAAGVPNVKPHDFRRFVGTRLARKNIRWAQKQLGHKRLETTARHYVLDETQLGTTDNLY